MCANRSYVKELIAATIHGQKQRRAREQHVAKNGWLQRKLRKIQDDTRPLTAELRAALLAEGQPSWAQPLWANVRGVTLQQQPQQQPRPEPECDQLDQQQDDVQHPKRADRGNWPPLRANVNSMYGRLCAGPQSDDAAIVRSRFPYARRRLIGYHNCQ